MTLADFLRLNVFYAPADAAAGAADDGDTADIDGAPPLSDADGPADAPAARPDSLLGRKAEGEGDDAADGEDRSDADPSKAPEGIPAKFWNEEKGELKADEMAKAYTTLEAAHARLKQDKGKADVPEKPEDYFDADKPFEVPEEADRVALEADDPGMQGYAKVAQKWGLSKDQMQGLAKDFMVEMNPLLDAPLDVEAEAAKLGKNGQAVIETNRQWIEGMFDSKMIKDEHVDIAYKMSSTAAGVEFMNILRGMTGEKPIPLSADIGGSMTREEYQSKMNELMQKNDYAGQEALDRKWAAQQ